MRAVARRKGFNVIKGTFFFECDACGANFEPAPESFVPTGFVQITGEREATDLFLGRKELLTRGRLESLSEYELTKLGLTPEHRQVLLQEGVVSTGVDALCPDCLHQHFLDVL